MNKGTVYWITGLSGAGKTTVGKILYERIRAKKPNVFFLDSDAGRIVFNDKCGYSREERLDGAYRNARVCKMIADQGIDVICSTISMFDEVRDWNRANIENYKEIYLEVPMEVLIKRDQKGLYTKVQNGECKDVAGMDMKLAFPKAPDIKVVNDGTLAPEKIVEMILSD
ncbi:adenylyl-sulfate kinase [Selenomonas sp. AB3002]|uniref:adenylyl-sulfate kinase n=1 Tax=Selenomonas sp. AB3002 TaxID=1392502 RepID=UPI000495341B